MPTLPVACAALFDAVAMLVIFLGRLLAFIPLIALASPLRAFAVAAALVCVVLRVLLKLVNAVLSCVRFLEAAGSILRSTLAVMLPNCLLMLDTIFLTLVGPLRFSWAVKLKAVDI